MRRYHKILDIVLLFIAFLIYMYFGCMQEGVSFGVIFKYLFIFVLSVFFLGFGFVVLYIGVMLIKYGGIFTPFITFPIWITTGLPEWLLISICIWFLFSCINLYTAYKCKYKTIFHDL